MKRWALSFVTGLVLLVTAGGAEADLRDGHLGSACAEDGECVEGLVCLLPSGTELGSGGPAHGLCTLACASDDDCGAVAPGALCRGADVWLDDALPPGGTPFCVESCAIAWWWQPGIALDSGKCHGRPEMACDCRGSACDTSLCMPRCAADVDCDPGYCNPSTGLCQSARPHGDPPGSPCTLSAFDDPCLGICDLDAQTLAGTGNSVGICVEPCEIGAPLACSVPTPGHARRACLGDKTAEPTGNGPGDVNACVGLCDGPEDCTRDEHCEPTDSAAAFSAVGLCTPGAAPPDGSGGGAGAGGGGLGGGDSGGAVALSCDDGPVRACKLDGCLGTAECQPDGTYGTCQCLDDTGASGGAPALVPKPEPRVSSGCNVGEPRGRVPGRWLFALLAGGLVTFARRRSAGP